MKLKRVLFVLMFGLIALLLVACGGKTVESIEVEGLTFPQLIKVGDPVTLDKTAVKIIVTYDNGDVDTIKLDDVELSGAIAIDKLDTAEKGKKTISISYKGTSIDVDFVVHAKMSDAGTEMTQAGSEAYPYLIETAEHLRWIAAQVNSGEKDFEGEYFQLLNDIDMSGLLWEPIGKIKQKINNTEETHTFKGVFDGNNKTIKNLMVNNEGQVESKSSTNYYADGLGALQAQGFFGHVTGATIKNLTFDNAYVKGLESVAVVAAISYGNTLIENVKIKNSIITSSHWTGALVGYAGGTVTIKNSIVESSSFGAFVHGLDANGDKLGALVGWATPTIVLMYNIVRDVELTAYRDFGGLVGYTKSTEPSNIFNNEVINVILRLDKSQMTNPEFRDGEKDSNRFVGAIIGRNVENINDEDKLSSVLSTATNVKTYIREESQTQYVEYVTLLIGKKAQTGYTKKES